MFAAAGIVPLLALIYLRPQEFVDLLRVIPFLYVFAAMSVFGLAADLRLRQARADAVPQLPWAIAFVAWMVVVTVIGAPVPVMVSELGSGLVAFTLFAVISHGVQTLRALRLVVATIAVCALLLIVVAVHQGTAPTGCVRVDPSDFQGMQLGQVDGRPCDQAIECYTPDAAPGADYACEHVGLFGTTSVKRRVRYRGVLQDPNELAVAVSIGLPLVFALAITSRRLRWRLLAGLAVVGGAIAVIMTESRGGQVVLLTVLGVYFVRRFGAAPGIVVGVLATLPALLMGGRGGSAAESSVEHRYESWQAGFDMLKDAPITGVGKGMFVEYNFLTAHNSFVLAAAELGIVGYVLWVIVLYLSVKIPIVALRDFADEPRAGSVRVWATAIVAALCGLGVAMLLLSLSYHYLLWIHLGLSGALYTAIRSHAPGWRVRFGLPDAALAVGGALVMLGVTALLLRVKGY